ncbi:MAG: peptide-methionine (S)-S-oxide reductase [Microgenomates group bacterium Gr01-1014_16]|nr:MAG: peptide-methionine (S)-S-oxide reductase [Microgenomates group bacterium Gr01-1014_16]
MEEKIETAIFAGGCFWCTEAVFRKLKGVDEVMPGYANSNKANPTYGDVFSGSTGAAEAIQVKFDPEIISYEKLLEVFFAVHDPTSLNKQGADEGTQYRSAVFYHDEEQRNMAEAAKAKIAGAVTEISPLTNFCPAENFHKDYYEKNRTAGYCRIVIDPKITKLYKEFGSMVIF